MIQFSAIYVGVYHTYSMWTFVFKGIVVVDSVEIQYLMEQILWVDQHLILVFLIQADHPTWNLGLKEMVVL